MPDHNPNMTLSIGIQQFAFFFDKMEPPRQDQAPHQDKVRAHHLVLSEYDPVESGEYCQATIQIWQCPLGYKDFLFFDKMEPTRQDQATHQDMGRAHHSVLSEYNPIESGKYCPVTIRIWHCLLRYNDLPFFDEMEPPRKDQATYQDKVRAPPFDIIRIWPLSNPANMARSNHPNIAWSQSEYDTAYIGMMYCPNIARSYHLYGYRSDHLRSGRPVNPNTNPYHTKTARRVHLSNLASRIIR